MIQQMIMKARLRAVQIHLDGIDAVLETVLSPRVKNEFIERRIEVKRAMHRLEGEYKEACVRSNKWEVV